VYKQTVTLNYYVFACGLVMCVGVYVWYKQTVTLNYYVFACGLVMCVGVCVQADCDTELLCIFLLSGYVCRCVCVYKQTVTLNYYVFACGLVMCVGVCVCTSRL